MIVIYPNPVVDVLKIIFPTSSKRNNISIFNIHGVLVFDKITNTQFLEVDAKSLKEGIYFVQIKSTDGIRVKKIVVSR